VPGLLQNVGNMRVAKIEDRVEAGVIVKGGEQTESGGNNQKADEHTRFFARLLHERFPIFGVGSHSPDQKINKDREAKHQFGAIAERESKKCSRQKRPKFNENKIQSRYLAEEGEAKRNLPGAAEAEIAPGPRPKNQNQRK